MSGPPRDRNSALGEGGHDDKLVTEQLLSDTDLGRQNRKCQSGTIGSGHTPWFTDDVKDRTRKMWVSVTRRFARRERARGG